MNRIILKAKLQAVAASTSTSMSITEFDSGEAFVRHCERHRLGPGAVVIVDQYLQLGGLLGSEAIKHVRQLGCKAFVIACSANHSEDDVAMYRASGANETWPKPYPENGQMAVDMCGWVQRLGVGAC